jgi:hypothetical protein
MALKKMVPQVRWMVYSMENPSINMDDDWGYPHDYGNLYMKDVKKTMIFCDDSCLDHPILVTATE